MTRKNVISIVLLAIGLLTIAYAYNWIQGLIIPSHGPSQTFPSERVVWLAALAETLRAWLTNWLYIRHAENKDRLIIAVRFGLICSLLIGTLWIFVGAAYMEPETVWSFVVDDSIILLLQGIYSGYILWFIHKPLKA